MAEGPKQKDAWRGPGAWLSRAEEEIEKSLSVATASSVTTMMPLITTRVTQARSSTQELEGTVDHVWLKGQLAL